MDKMQLRTQAEQIRHQWGIDLTSPVDIFACVKRIDNVTLISYPFGENVSGICAKSQKSSVIAVNSMQTLGRQRFTLAHEIYHYYFDNTGRATVCPVQVESGNEEEQNADMFASYLLVPPLTLSERIAFLQSKSSKCLNVRDVIALEQYFQVSRKAMLFRLREEQLITQEESKAMEQNVRFTASTLGYDVTLYESSPVDRQKNTWGYYIEKAEELLKEHTISIGKYEEYLIDAFREDIVFGIVSEGEYVD